MSCPVPSAGWIVLSTHSANAGVYETLAGAGSCRRSAPAAERQPAAVSLAFGDVTAS